YRNFIKSGGVTISGGEPLLQPEFTLAVINGCKKNGFHTAVDTAGFAPLIVAKPVIDAADLVTQMQEIKHYYTKGVKARKGIEK
ncbi:MAG: cob(I)yrinic acid a,c-diamide adenosyltransferase, partial [Oscillospiraceae bacterium]